MTQRIFSGKGSINVQIGSIKILKNELFPNSNSPDDFELPVGFSGNTVKNIHSGAAKYVKQKKLFPLLNYYRGRQEITNIDMALVFFDIDKFTQINNVHGVKVGDQIIARVYQLLNGSMLGHIFARIGPDELIGVLIGLDSAHVERYTGYLINKVVKYDWLSECGVELYISLTAGIAKLNRNSHGVDVLQEGKVIYPGDNEYFDERVWITRAYAGMLRAKREGRKVVEGPDKVDVSRVKSIRIKVYQSGPGYVDCYYKPEAPEGWESEWKQWTGG